MNKEYADLKGLIENFEAKISESDIRPKVLHLVRVLHKFRALGITMIPESTSSGRERILLYFQKYPYTVISGEELLVVSGIQEYARRLRELRNKFGWAIISSETAKEMLNEGELQGYDAEDLKSDSYILISEKRDKEGADRFNRMNEIKKSSLSSHDKLLEVFRMNLGKPVSGEELKHVTNNSTEWARRVRELRTEKGWPIVTKNTGKSSLAVGYYELAEDRQDQVHDRQIRTATRIKVFDRDNNACRKCNWPKNSLAGDIYRNRLECHHIEHHKNKGANTIENLITLCNVDHDEIHRLDKKGEWSREQVLNWINSGV